VNFATRQVVRLGKGGRRVVFPITETIREILFPLQGQHPEFVFTYVAVHGNKRLGRVRGQRYPLTIPGAKSAWQSMRTKAGVKDFRFHDYRHDFGTKLLRETGNLKLVQKALNHRDIKSTCVTPMCSIPTSPMRSRPSRRPGPQSPRISPRLPGAQGRLSHCLYCAIRNWSPSFGMSFAATLGLVALVQFGMPRLFASAESSAATRVALWGGRELMLLLLASLVAGFATTPYAAFHFRRVTPYGVLANLAAMPVYQRS